MLETSQPVKPFIGVRFVLLGFDSGEDSRIRYKLIDGGGVDSGQYNPNCTHVIVNKTVNDDPVCVAARKDCKTVVTSLWVDHSYDLGMPVDFTSVMYRPPKDLTGIPGAKGLVICLTGYQRQDRDDIMTLVGLMGAQFSKPLVANKVTHLICYKFEGEKYELGKKLSKIKLVNHRWLEDCLKEWEILPEANYSKSGYELEVMGAEAKDSEEEAEDTSFKPLAKETVPKSPFILEQSFPQARNSPILGVGITKTKLSAQETDFISEGTSKLDNIPVTRAFEYKSVDDIAQHQYQSPIHKNAANNLTPSSRRTERLPHSDAKTGSVSYTRKLLRNLGDLSGNQSGFDKDAMKAEDLSSSLAKQYQAEDAGGSKLFESPKRNLSSGERPLVYSQQNCVQTNSYGTPNLRKTGNEVRPCIRKSLSPNDKVHGHSSSFFDGLGDTDIIEAEVADKEIVNGANRRLKSMEPANWDEKSSPSPLNTVKTFLPGSTELSDFDAGNSSLHQQDDKGTAKRKSNHERDKPSSLNPVRNEDSTTTTTTTATKLIKKETATKKTLGSRLKMASKAKKRESMGLDKRDSTKEEAVGFSRGEGKEKSEIAVDSAHCEVPIETETRGGLQREDSATRRTVTALEDETETPEDRDDHTLDKAAGEIEDASLINDVTVNACHVAPQPEIEGNVLENVDDTNLSVPSLKSKRNSLKRKNAKEKATTSGKKKAKKVVDTTEGLESNKECVDADVTRNKTDGVAGDMENTKNEVKSPAVKLRASDKMLEKLAEEDKENTPVDREAENKSEAKSDSKKKAKTPSNSKKSSVKTDDPGSSGKTESVVVERDSKKQAKTRSDIKKSSEKRLNFKSSEKVGNVVDIARSKPEPVLFILTGHRFQRREYQKIIRRLRGKVCRVTHQWSYQATHFVVPEPIRRTEKFFAAAASGRWILKTEYLTASSEAGKFLKEEDYEWHMNGLNDDGAINLEAPRKWRLLRQRTCHGAFYGMRIIIYGDCIAPSLDTLKRVVKAGDGTIVATSPPYTRFLDSGVDFVVVSPGMPRVDAWVQEFLKHELPCIAVDYLVEFVCKPGSSLERHILYNTNAWAHKSQARLEALSKEVVLPEEEEDDVPCGVCGSRARGEVMLICGDEGGVRGCGIGCHIDCCDPPMEAVPQDDWFCSSCTRTEHTTKKSKKKK